MIRTNTAMKLLTTVLLTAATAFAQSSDRLPVTDAEKIADAKHQLGPRSNSFFATAGSNEVSYFLHLAKRHVDSNSVVSVILALLRAVAL